MDIKFLDEDNTQPRKTRRKQWIIFLLLAVAIIVGMCVLYYTHSQNESTPTFFPSSSNAQVTSALQSSIASSQLAVSSPSPRNKAFQQSSDWSLLLVNAKIKIPDNFTPQIANYDNVQMDKRIMPYFVQMKAAAAKDGITLWLSGGYRSIEDQQQLFQQMIQNNISRGLSQSVAEQEARKNVSEPGYSEHNTGLALDFNGSQPDFVSTDAYEWLQKHAAEYGFIQRYPQGKESITGIAFQPWFYRYVGVDNAKKMNMAKQCMEEFLQAT